MENLFYPPTLNQYVQKFFWTFMTFGRPPQPSFRTMSENMQFYFFERFPKMVKVPNYRWYRDLDAQATS